VSDPSQRFAVLKINGALHSLWSKNGVFILEALVGQISLHFDSRDMRSRDLLDLGPSENLQNFPGQGQKYLRRRVLQKRIRESVLARRAVLLQSASHVRSTMVRLTLRDL